jgi:hypothetical protein
MDVITQIQNKWNWVLIAHTCGCILEDPSSIYNKTIIRKLLEFATRMEPYAIYTIVEGDKVLSRRALGEKIRITKIGDLPTDEYAYIMVS